MRWNSINVKFTILEIRSLKCYFWYIKFLSCSSSHLCSIVTKTEMCFFQFTGDVVMLSVVQMGLAVRWHRCLYQWLVYIRLLSKYLSHLVVGSFSCHQSRCGPPENRCEVVTNLGNIIPMCLVIDSNQVQQTEHPNTLCLFIIIISLRHASVVRSIIIS